MSRVLINGVEAEYIRVYDRGLQYGDGLFETILCHHRSLYYWPQHYQRLQQSAEKLKLDCPPQNLLLDEINQLLSGSNSSSAVKIILTRGNSERGYAFTDSQAGRRILLCSELPSDYSALIAGKLDEGRLFVCRTQASINETLAGLKHLNRLENVIARNEFGDDCMDGLMLNADNHVVEGCMSNLFAIKGNEVFTPDVARSGVNGIMRGRIMAIIEQLDYPLHIRAMTLTEVVNMDTLFITNSLIGMRAVTAVAEKDFPTSELTRQIFKALLVDSREQLTRV